MKTLFSAIFFIVTRVVVVYLYVVRITSAETYRQGKTFKGYFMRRAVTFIFYLLAT